MTPVDLVLVEGFRRDPIAKLEVHRPALGKPPLWPDWPDDGGRGQRRAAAGLRPEQCWTCHATDAIATWIVSFVQGIIAKP